MTADLDQTVFFVEDDEQLRLATVQALELAGLSVRPFSSAETALAELKGAFDGAIVSDVRMPRMDGLQLLAAVRAIDPDIPVILVTGHGDVAMAVATLKDGAFDFLTKPFAAEHLIAVVRRGLERRALQIENRRLRAAAEANEAQSSLIGASAAMARLRSAIRQLAAADLDVLIEGETGTGKELVARFLHRLGPRRGRPFVAVNCAALSEAHAEFELFGYAIDSAPHTRMPRKGQIAASNGGTLLLDEIDSMPVNVQGHLLRVLEEREVRPIGAEHPEPIDLHVVATTKVDLQVAATQGRFRSDLFHRLAVTRLRVPPLREREDDVALLFAEFVDEAKSQLNRPDATPNEASLYQLRSHHWPGNVRELRNFAFATVLGLPNSMGANHISDKGGLKERVAAFEAAAITEALESARGNVGAAMQILGLPRKTFYDKIARLNLRLPELRTASRRKESE